MKPWLPARVIASVVASWCVSVLGGCNLPGTPGAGPCKKSDCDFDYVRLTGSVAKSLKEPFHFSLQLCADGVCEPEVTGTASIEQGWRGDGVGIRGKPCIAERAPVCERSDQWWIWYDKDPREAPDDGFAQTYRFIVKDLDTGKVLVDREFETVFETVQPDQCEGNPDNISCQHFEATWDE